jgi:MFS family permease
LLGLIICIDKPALLSFVKDLVGGADLPNAVALNNAAISSGRMIGPVISGVIIASFGMAPSFLINAISFGLVVLVLMVLDVARLPVTRPGERKPGQVREGLSYIRQDHVLMLTVIAMSVIFIAAYNFQVMVPLVASRMFNGSSELFGIAMSSLGLGAVLGSLLIASWVKPGVSMIAVRATEHRSYLAGFTAWNSFCTFWRIFAGCFLWFFQRHSHQHPATQSA